MCRSSTMTVTGCNVSYSADNEDGDGPAWVASLIISRDGTTLYRYVDESPDYQTACETALVALDRHAQGRGSE